MSETIDDEIEELALEIESLIKDGKAVNDEFEDEFDSKYRRMEKAQTKTGQLFS